MKNIGEYDYVIIGAGSAGCVVANRLSADPKIRVLLVEAGPPDRNLWLKVPIGYAKTISNPSLSWNYQTAPEPELNDRSIIWPRGKVLGGSSSVNGLIYTRGQAEDYNHWRQIGNLGWDYNSVLPYFRRSERQIRGADEWHGDKGPLAVSDLEPNTLGDSFIEAAQQAGLPINQDFNGATQEGAGYFQVTTRKGVRCSAAQAFLKPIRHRKNLKILTRYLVTRLIITERRVTGVTFRDKTGENFSVSAKHEVILSAGSINSPQILELSGIGSGDRLRQVGVDVVHDLPGVGHNLQDHFQVRSIFRCRKPITLNDDLMNPLRLIRAGINYVFRRSGPMTFSAGSAGCFAKVHPSSKTPDTQIHFITFSTDRPGEGLHKFSAFTSSTCYLRPESRGEVHITSSDPSVPPRIQANYLTATRDQEMAVRGLRLSRRVIAQPAMTQFFQSEERPGSALNSDEELLEFARETGGTIFHPVGTCKMGPASDVNAVVDSELRVRGIDSLRVIDASIMPTLISANTNAPVIMIGEKGADFILSS